MIKISKSTSMYKLEISASEPKLTADITIAVMNELDKHQQEYNSKKTTETRQFIEERLIDAKKELEYAEVVLKNFRETNRNIISSPTLQMQQERLARDVAVLIGVFTTLKQQLETAKIEEVKKSDYVVILDLPETPIYPDKPKKRLMVILAGLLGIGLGIMFAFIHEYIKNSDNEEQVKLQKIKLQIINNITEFLPNRFKKA